MGLLASGKTRGKCFSCLFFSCWSFIYFASILCFLTTGTDRGTPFKIHFSVSLLLISFPNIPQL